MKQLIWFSNLTIGQSHKILARELYIQIRSGETIALVGEHDSGRQGFVDYLYGKQPRLSGSVRFETCDRTEEAERLLHNKIYRSVGTHFLFHQKGPREKIPLIEYLFLMRKDGCEHLLWKQKALKNRAIWLMRQVGLKRHPMEDIASLSPLECCLLNIAKALDSNAKLMVMEEDFEGYTVKDIAALAIAMDRVKRQHGLSFVLNADGLRGVDLLADDCFLFHNGTISKKLKRDNLREGLLHWIECTNASNISQYPSHVPGPIVLEAYGLPLGEKSFDLQIHYGELLHLVDYDIRHKERLFHILAGEELSSAKLLYHGKQLPKHWAKYRNKYRIVALDVLCDDALFENMTVQQNLIFSSLRKVCKLGFWLPGKSVLHAAAQEWEAPRNPMPLLVEELTHTEKLALQMESWRIYHPEVLILLEPFLYLDHTERKVLLESFERLRDRGTAVVVISSSKTSYMGSHRYKLANWYDRMVVPEEATK